MAAKKTARAKSRKTITRAKATRKSSVRSSRKAPKYNTQSGTSIEGPIEIF